MLPVLVLSVVAPQEQALVLVLPATRVLAVLVALLLLEQRTQVQS